MTIENLSRNEILTLLEDKSEGELLEIYDKALSKLPSRAPIFLPTEKIPLRERIAGVEHVRQIYKSDFPQVYQGRLRELREKYKGTKRCFLIGNGPSLNRTDLSVLKNEVTFAVNGFFLKAEALDWQPTFYCVEDHLVAEDRAPWINRFKGSIKLFPAYLGYVFPADEDTIFYNHRPRKSYPDGFDFSLEADKITYTGCTVTFSIMQLAAYFGFEEIYLIGVDASYEIPKDVDEDSGYGTGILDMKSDDPNHFDPDYFGKGFRWHDPQVDQMIEAYKEANRILIGSQQKIYNATVGGNLEVFERRDFSEIFLEARSPDIVEREVNARLDAEEKSKPPRMLVIDMTPMGSHSATGQVKANLFDGWASGDLLQIASPSPDAFSIVERHGWTFSETPVSAIEAREKVLEFAPEVILYRPLADRPALHDLGMDLIHGAYSDTPLVTWMMDDWPARLEKTDPRCFKAMEKDLLWLLNKADLNFSISDKMSAAFQDRYGVEFKAYANGVHPNDWPNKKDHKAGPLLIRYAGGLAPDMNLESVLRLSKAVEELAKEGHKIKFEINTQVWWKKKSGHLFEKNSVTSISTANRSFADYAAWVSEADVVVIAYNFDEESKRYVRYSMANKLPECLMSGASLLIHGPRDLATVDYVAALGVAELVSEDSLDELKAALLRLTDPYYREKLASFGRHVAVERHSLPTLRRNLERDISSILGSRKLDTDIRSDGFLAKEKAVCKKSDRKADWSLHPSCDLDRIIENLEDDNKERLLVTFTNPVGILSSALTAGENLQNVLDEWEDEATKLLNIVQHNRSRLALVDRDSLLHHQDSYRVALANQAVLVPDTLPEPDLPAGSLYNALATTLVAQDERVRRLLDELRASAIWPLDVPQAPMIDMATALAELADLKARAKDAENLGATKRRLEFVETTLTETRADLQKERATRQQSEAALEENRAELEIKSEQIGQLRKISENDAQLVSKLNADLQGAHDNQHALSQRIDELHAELDRVFNSKSWKVTEPLRGLRRLFSRGNSEGGE